MHDQQTGTPRAPAAGAPTAGKISFTSRHTKAIMAALIGLLLALMAGSYWFIATQLNWIFPRPASEQTFTLVKSGEIPMKQRNGYQPPILWFDSAEEAAHSISSFSGYPLAIQSDCLIRVDDDNSCMLFYAGEHAGDRGAILAYIMDKSGDRYSSPIFVARSVCEPSLALRPFAGFSYDETERVARYIQDLFLTDDIFTHANNGQAFTFGIATTTDVYNLSILGQRPKGIVPFTIKDTQYYLWYYDDTDFTYILATDPRFDPRGYTYGDMVEILQIRFD